MKKYITVMFGLFGLWASIFVAVAYADQPGRDDVHEAIQAELEPGISVSNFDFKVFAGDGAGRVSVAGNLMITEDRVELIRYNVGNEIFYNEVMARGVKKEDFSRFARDLGLYMQGSRVPYKFGFIRTVVRKNETYPFEAEYQYAEKVRGFSFRGQIDYSFPGKTIRELESPLFKQYIEIGSVAYQNIIDKMAGKAEHERNAIPKARDEFLSFFKKGAVIVSEGGLIGEIDGFDSKNLKWEKSRITDGQGQHQAVYMAKFDITLRSLIVAPFKIRNLKVPAEQVVTTQLALIVPLNINVERGACMDIAYNNSPQNFTCWDGTAYSIPMGLYGGFGSKEMGDYQMYPKDAAKQMVPKAVAALMEAPPGEACGGVFKNLKECKSIVFGKNEKRDVEPPSGYCSMGDGPITWTSLGGGRYRWTPSAENVRARVFLLKVGESFGGATCG